MSDERIPMTRDEYDGLKAKIDHMQSVQMIEITKRVAAARDMGDLSENAEYHAAREDQGILQAKINHLKNELAMADIIDMNNIAKDVVAFGASVRVKDLDLDEEETYMLVGPGKEDFSQNKILTSSPIGKGLVGKKPGDIAEIQVPMGTLRYQVVEIRFGT
jgi:transcription elongation factor GreA